MRIFGTVRDKQKGPLARVPVTDGRNIVFTDEHGVFQLEVWDRGEVLSLNLLTKGHDDWYLPLSPHQDSYDFEVLLADPPAEEFSLLHTSDTEIEGEFPLDWVDFLKEKKKQTQCSLFIHTGDIARLEGMRRHRLALNYETLGCPVRYTVGNHDLTGPRYGEEYYQQYYGPCWYSFDMGSVHFIALSINKGEVPLRYDPEDQWIWLEQDLAHNKDKTLVVITHGEYRGPYRFHHREYDPVKMGVKAWIYGHLHSNFATENNRLLHICTNACNKGGICSCEAAVRQITFGKTGISSRLLTAEKQAASPEGFLRRRCLGESTLFCRPVEKDGFLYLATNDDGWEKHCHVYKLDPETLEILWKFPTVNGVKNNLAFSQELVFCQDTQGEVYAIDRESGKKFWQVSLTIPKIPYTKKGVLLAEGALICGSELKVCALDPQDGSLLWCTTIPSADASASQWVYDPLHRQIIVSANWKCLYSLDVTTGEMLWQNFAPSVWFRNATPAVIDDFLFTSGGHYLNKIGRSTGAITQCLWTDHVFDSVSPPVDGGDAIYLSSSTGGVFAVDKENLQRIRRYEASPAVVHTAPYKFRSAQTVEGSPVLWKDKVIFAAGDGFLYVYHRDSARLEQRYELGASCLTTPLVNRHGITLVTVTGDVLTYPLPQ